MTHEHQPRVSVAAIIALLSICSCAATQTVTARNSGTAGTGAHVNGLRNGAWIESYADGRKQSEGSYENDVQTGLWTYWFENGNKEMEGRFVDERREGQWTSWYANGSMRAQGRFERGFEEGLWRFHASSGALDHIGMFELGKPVLRWTYFAPDGSVRATGNYLAGVKVGEWTEQDAAGNTSVVAYPLPASCECVEEHFADSTLKRTGFVRDGVPTGRWNTYHPNGKLRLECVFSAGEPNGRACAWRADETLLAEGTLKDGCLTGEWLFSNGLVQEQQFFAQPRPRQAFEGDWSPASSADQPGRAAVETWVAEACSPRQPAPTRNVSVTTPSAHASTSASGEISGVPARAQPWTEYEQRALPALLQLYGSGSTNSATDHEDWKTPAELATKSTADAAALTPPDFIGLVGRSLPLTRFTTADGGEIDLADYAGKRNVLVTILRGFGGQVCVYCTAQTKSLADFADEFAAAGTEVVVIFPGPTSGLAAFLEAYRRTFGADEKLPYKLLYDSDLKLTRALHIEDNIAVPTTLVLDRKGIIRWAHVAADYADRPSARAVLEEIKALPKTQR